MGEFRKRDIDNVTSSARIVAGSDLVFKDDNNIYLNGTINNVWTGGTLDMANFSLTIAKKYFISEGRIKNAANLIISDQSALSNLNIDGDVNIKGNGMIFNNDVYFNDNVTVLDTLQTYPYYGASPTFKKNLINYEFIKDNWIGHEFNPVILGNIYNYGTWKCKRTYLQAQNKNDSLYGIYSTYMYLQRAPGATSGNFYTVGTVKSSGTIELQGDVILYNNAGCELVNTGTISGNRNVINYGKIYFYT